jgi:hypothetical protein
MDILLTREGMILNAEEIEEMRKTDEGKRKLREYMFSAKTAYATNALLDYLEREAHILSRPFTAEEQQIICSLIYWAIFDSKWSLIDAYIRDVVKAYEKGDLDEFLTCGSNCGNC